MSPNDVLSGVRSALEAIADALDAASLVVPTADRSANETMRTATVDTIRQYLLHRLREPDAPVVAVLVGLSGVGKSTLLNSLAQEAVSPVGAIRPTTRSAVLWAHKDHAARYWTEFVGRVRDHVGPTTDVVIGEDSLTQFLTFIDTPPLGLEPAEGSLGAGETLMFADICIFVTSADRYADAAPFAFLETARARGIPVLFVLNKAPTDPDRRIAVLGDYAGKLVDAGLLPEADPGFVFATDRVERLRWHGGLGPEVVAPLRKELSEISDPEFRLVVVDETAEATLLAAADRAARVADALERDATARRALWSDVAAAYEPVDIELRERIERGGLAELAHHEVWSQAAADIAGLVTRAAGTAADRAAAAWRRRDGGPGLIEPGHEGLRRHGAGTAAEARSRLDRWHHGLGAIVLRQRRPPRRKRRLARLEAELWRCALDPGRESRWWTGDRAAGVVEARRRLGDEVGGILRYDAARFGRRLGPGFADGIPDEVRDAIAYLRDLTASETDPAVEGAARGG